MVIAGFFLAVLSFFAFSYVSFPLIEKIVRWEKNKKTEKLMSHIKKSGKRE
jgi:hypothetical protein